MSAPDTNVKKQVRRHVGPIVGMVAVAIIAVGLAFYWQYRDVPAASGSGTGPTPTVTPVGGESGTASGGDATPNAQSDQ